MLSRREFIKTALVGGAATGIGLSLHDLRNDAYTSDFQIEQLVINISGLPQAFNDYRIGFITDIHIGTWVPEEWFERALDSLASYGVDLLLLGGDYILVHESSLWDSAGLIRNARFSRLSKSLAISEIYKTFTKCAARFKCPDGILAIVGNHDHWNAYPELLKALRDFPQIQLLINEEVSIKRGDQELHIFGVDDYLTGLPKAPPVKQLQDAKAKRIVLSHNPDYLTTILKRPDIEFSLALCGHTHGGQVVLPVVGPIGAPVMDQRFVSGMCLVGDKQVYTSRGLGVVGVPFRFNCPAEVTVITLRPALSVG
jgi:predicted MPP superfamily phosphohydrolase